MPEFQIPHKLVLKNLLRQKDENLPIVVEVPTTNFNKVRLRKIILFIYKIEMLNMYSSMQEKRNKFLQTLLMKFDVKGAAETFAVELNSAENVTALVWYAILIYKTYVHV